MGVVSERKPVGSTKNTEADLLGDDVASSTTGPAANGASAAQGNDALLAEIFGSSSDTPTATTGSAAPAKPRSTVDDILGLFGSTSAPSPAPASPAPTASPATTAPASSMFSLPQSQAPPPQQPQQPRLTAYTAYEKNELRITLTPQTSAAKPGYVNILARFQITGSSAATGLVFQAAVPRVRLSRVRGNYDAEMNLG